MDKNIALEQLRTAKAAHISWVQKAKLLIAGLEIDKNSIPVNSTECKFGQWFYSDAQKLNALRNNNFECMATIEELHFKLHDVYLKIFKLYYSVEKQGFLAKLFGKKQTTTEETKEQAEGYYAEMEAISKELIVEINRLERRVIAIPKEEIEEL